MIDSMKQIPAHIAIIMDGNGRWAQQRFLQKNAGHKAGAQTLKKIAYEAEKMGVQYLTVYAFSTENWKRSPEEVEGLMNLLRSYIKQYIDDTEKNNMRISIIGERKRLAPDLLQQIQQLEHITKEKPGLHLIIALDYGARDEITRCVKKLYSDISNSLISIDEVSEDLLSQYMDTAIYPDPDLLIRTSGELRLSNFLLWQLAYTELFFTDKLWPDFKKQDLEAAIAQYQKRERRFGGR